MQIPNVKRLTIKLKQARIFDYTGEENLTGPFHIKIIIKLKHFIHNTNANH